MAFSSSEVRALRRLDPFEAAHALRCESIQLELTKALLSILYNICIDQSVRLSHALRRTLQRHEEVVLGLLEGAKSGLNKTRGLQRKKYLLLRNPHLVIALAQACPSNPGVPSY